MSSCKTLGSPSLKLQFPANGSRQSDTDEWNGRTCYGYHQHQEKAAIDGASLEEFASWVGSFRSITKNEPIALVRFG